MAGGGRGPAGAARRRAPLGGHGRALRARPAAAPVSGGRAAGLRAAAGGRGAGGCAGRCWGLCGESRAWLRERAEMPSEGREPRPTSLRPSPRSAAMRSAARAWAAPPGPARPRQRREERAPEEAPRCSVRDRGLPTVGLLCAGCRLLGGFLLRGNAKKGAGGDCCGFRVSPSAVRGGERRAFSRVPLCHRGLCRARGCCVCGRLPSFPPRGFRRAPIFYFPPFSSADLRAATALISHRNCFWTSEYFVKASRLVCPSVCWAFRSETQMLSLLTMRRR